MSTAHDVSAYKRAFTQGKLLPPELQRILTDRPPGDRRPLDRTRGVCGDDLYIMGGNGPGFLAMTFYSEDGRRQFAVSATLSGKDTSGAGQAMGKAMETVFCPSS
ncbi:hypothetical protein ACFQHO_46860 [Actinomadura yumaensis]|uniref:hypothetical protein n=1 Tax=Actinomadura TaxID=1988 RepID=UPI00132248EE|nr:hypothetical protein [Actinomadura sp. J1-007]MWK39844.1 hypothetical protein [Actinomadura sp. J1-007]